MTSTAERTLEAQLSQAGIPFEREWKFHPNRKWRADFVVSGVDSILVEIDGGAFIGGRHSRGTGVEADAEKQSAAAILGYRVIRATPRQVEDGRCLEWIRRALGVADGSAPAATEALRQIKGVVSTWQDSYSDTQGIGTDEALQRIVSILASPEPTPATSEDE